MNPPMVTPSSQLDHNLQVYASSGGVSAFAQPQNLKKAEAAILKLIAEEVRNQRVLDIGVGAGRTTPFLLELSPHYVGFDYSPEMVAACRQRFPGVQVMEGDARKMGDFLGSEKFGFILFAWNGLDCIGHEDRLTVLAQVFRLLQSRGLFVFSSHNLNAPPRKPWDPSLHEWSANPRSWLRYLYYAARWSREYLRRRHLEKRGRGYAVLVDDVHDFHLVNYCVDPREQVRQLEAQGFADIRFFDIDGQECELECPSLNRGSVYYLARKP